ncbi:hypothetical protein GMOD_00007004 [Pyrenophora seminiperda CCB06]|uniref:rRNA methyltransferase 2, mitochondrial n=1 Tax=Pyrenophora seminiperda CCB06 TaxID=1302712 RepID=A0A3M7MBX2_9PLEO|nr:hypothetical protein GMOD_00007004 [Pyrenophora seminiperda CCB06]
MLSRRLLQQLTESVLFEFPHRPVTPVCFASQCATCRFRSPAMVHPARHSSSSTRWKSRQGRDFFAREARVKGLKSRAAFKLLELNDKHKLFKPGQTVVDLVAVNRTLPDGRVIGIDLIPAQPPRGVSTLQGNFLSPVIQEEVRAYVRDAEMGRPTKQAPSITSHGLTEEELDKVERGYVDMERHAHLEPEPEPVEQPGEREHAGDSEASPAKLSLKERDVQNGRVVDVVLSDMSEPWEQTEGLYKKSLSDPYFRMMNTSGNGFRDHAGSMDLCMAAMTFAFDTLKTGGHFLCKYYKGAEEKAFETRMKRLFAKVYREKPDSSRAESKEAYFVGLRRKETATKEEVFGAL